ncbi:MAG: hypothetical protein Q9207_005702 [Kuettlingeria erythrocarpa]
MLLHTLAVVFASFTVSLANDLAGPLTCWPKDEAFGGSPTFLAAATSRKHYGSGGSMLTPTQRCPRIKPTVTVTQTVTTPGVSTVPTSQGFTPILSETYSVSLNPYRRRQLPSPNVNVAVVSLGPQGHFTTSVSSPPHSLICGPATSSPSPTLVTPSSCPTVSTLTLTTSTTVAASTIYDACASNNLVNQGFGKGKDHGIGSLVLQNITANTDTVNATTAYDCCVACQMLGCAYGEFLVNEPYPYCELYFQDKCEPRTWLGSTFEYNADVVGPLPPSMGYTVFNGPCGQIVYGGSNGCKDPPCL